MMIERKDVSYMKDVIHIIGHKNPDTDSIVSSIAYAELKRTLGINAIACRIGDLNTETDFVLKKFKVAYKQQNASCMTYRLMKRLPFPRIVRSKKHGIVSTVPKTERCMSWIRKKNFWVLFLFPILRAF